MTPEKEKALKDEAAVKYPLDVLGVPNVRTYAKREGYVAGVEAEEKRNESVLQSLVDHCKRLKDEAEKNESNELIVERNKVLIMMLQDLVNGYEQWEADIISNNAFWWPHAEKDALSGKLYEDMLLLQEKRNEAKEALKQYNK